MSHTALGILTGLACLLTASSWAAAQSRYPAPGPAVGAPKGGAVQSVMPRGIRPLPMAPLPDMSKRPLPYTALPRRPKSAKVKRRTVRRTPARLGTPHLGPLVLPWDAEVKRFRQRSGRLLGPDPQARLDQALRKLNQDPMARLGYSANVPQSRDPEAGPAAAAPAAPPAFDRFSGMDRDRDGAISRQEYMSARSRFFPAGRTGATRRRAVTARLKARFRRMDSNRDGRITAEELESPGDLRF